MSEYFIKIIILENCPYSIKAHDLLKSRNINHRYVMVSHSNKELYKTNKIETFPQIYLNKKNSNGNLLLGGCSDLEYAINKLSNKLTDNIISEFTNKYPNWAKNAIKKIYKLFNQI